MGAAKVTFIGTGDAFGSGGRLQTCILLDTAGIRLAIDFGASSLIGLRRQKIDPNGVGVIVLTHLHGDHCGGVPFLMLDAMLGSRRTTPLTIIGPPGCESHLRTLQAALFPGSQVMSPSFDVAHLEITAGQHQIRSTQSSAGGRQRRKPASPRSTARCPAGSSIPARLLAEYARA